MDRLDVHQHVTNQIIEMMEQDPGGYCRPWLQSARGGRPINVASGKAYRGMNVLALWATVSVSGYTSGVWGTFKQWSTLGARVRKGEKAAYTVFWEELTTAPGEGTPEPPDEPPRARRLVARASAVFAAEQVDGYMRKPERNGDPLTHIGRAEAVISATGARIRQEGEQAYYRPSTDTIHIPTPDQFVGTATLSRTEAYYATLLHELAHWTGHSSRCDRSLAGRFGQKAYAMEELIAELGAAFLCADLSISPTPRPDHAYYLHSWLSVLREDKHALSAAASQASKAAAFVMRSWDSDGAS